ncbi:MAG: MiaB/RimO family radical SAM methylthiotransferase [Kiritimatiellia bacterium]|jgi:threonylcarbamoyladenosine tRNA methylthiotransferase MtaB
MKIAIKTLGCRVNQAEAATIAGALECEGHEVVPDGGVCDVLVLHTCVVTAAAQRESMRQTRTARRAGAGGVVMTGCATSVVPPERILDGGVDAVVEKKTGRVYVGEEGAAATVARLVASALAGDGLCPHLPRFASTRASVKVQDGCDFRCAYCIVPDARGGPRSRPLAPILAEIVGLAAQGFREIVLTGVNVACWSDGEARLADLVREASRVDGVARIRLSSIEPGTAERAIVDLMAVAESRLCRTLHYPLQSGDAGVLKRMRRRYTPEQYAAAVEYALVRVPRLGLGADLIAGFPGEDDAAFEASVRMVACLPFSNLHVFPYSERPGTPAATMDGAVPVPVRRERARRLLAIGAEKRRLFAETFVGAEAEVLVERVDDDGVGRGWTSEYVEARIDGLAPSHIGRLLAIRVHSATDAVLSATPS